MRLLRRAGRILWVMLATFGGCGLQNTTAIPPHPCVGVADGGFGYQVTGKLIDARSGAPVCCVSINLEARLDVDPPDLNFSEKGDVGSDLTELESANSEPTSLFALFAGQDLVAGSGIRFADRGLDALKGVPGGWRLYAVEQCRPG